ncbi:MULTISPECIES: sugar ABC transporter substrate-binding protein [Methylobacterium]|uniref:sugar ABC transporter substrate-binding protein n=1 Tax=Methylobacterium TaxID=407 RepID=UPI0013EC1D87|nr:substrate-binding domain-containing protein [Methylobacterium sp. DB0501]NGM36955.1 substrate-binding domain-containing protein [Methylobacterium sp. DB0501]
MKSLLLSGFMLLAATLVQAQELKPLNPDSEPDRIDWSQLAAKLGPLPKPASGTRAGAVSKTLTNEYWRLLGEGYQSFAKPLGVKVAYQAAQNEGDQVGQLSIAETMIAQGVNVLLVSPQTNANLEPILGEAKTAGIPVVNVNDAVIPQAAHYVGNVQRDNGVRVARWFIANRPKGGKLAVIEGQAGVYAATQRTAGFKATLAAEGTAFKVVASVPGNWDRQLSYDAATTILQQHPDLVGFYCNNDTMALGVVEAVKNAGLLGKVAVFGTDGINDAHASIRAGELTGTVDSFPVLTGEVAMEAALRVLAKEPVPRVVATPQALVTKDNIERYKGKGADLRAVLEEDARSGK